MRVLPALLLAALAATGLPAVAQQTDAEIAARRGVLERQQQSETFALEVMQSQRRLAQPAPPAFYLRQRLEEDELHQSQLRRAMSSSSSEADASAFERERRALAARFASETPTWGPVLEAPRRWTPTVERAPRAWTPTLD
jgi:hypothetical protein